MEFFITLLLIYQLYPVPVLAIAADITQSAVDKPNEELTNIEKLLMRLEDRIAEVESVNRILESRIKHIEEENKYQKQKIQQLREENNVLRETFLKYMDMNAFQTKEEDLIQSKDQDVLHGHMSVANKTSYIRTAKSLSARVQSLTTPVAFSAYLDHIKDNIGTDQTIVYNRMLYSTGTEYNLYTGVFTAPVSGIYLFAWSCTAIQLNNRSMEMWASLMVNGVYKGDAIAESRANHEDHQGSNTLVLHVGQGDAVWVKRHTGDQIYGEEFWRSTTFTGVLLFQD